MNSEEFVEIFREQVRLCEDSLIGEPKEDVLHIIRKVAKESGDIPLSQALSFLLSDDIKDIYLATNHAVPTSIDMWTVKITDTINWLVYLKAIILEEADAQAASEVEQLALLERSDIHVDDYSAKAS